jgi:hypothetical protein
MALTALTVQMRMEVNNMVDVGYQVLMVARMKTTAT